MTRYYATIIASVLFSCSTRINYVGQTSLPTRNVDVYVDPSAIKKNYVIIGKGYISYPGTEVNMEKVQNRAIAKAMEKGADAVLFQDYYVTEEGTASYTAFGKTDSTSLRMHHSDKGRAVVTSKTDLLFLKYN